MKFMEYKIVSEYVLVVIENNLAIVFINNFILTIITDIENSILYKKYEMFL